MDTACTYEHINMYINAAWRRRGQRENEGGRESKLGFVVYPYTVAEYAGVMYEISSEYLSVIHSNVWVRETVL